ncbi:hypothetical protein FZC81_24225, partial [Enterobacter hormaechei]
MLVLIQTGDPNPLPGTLRPESRHCLTLIFLACRQVFYSRLREPSSTRLIVKSSRGPEPTTHGINMSETFTIVGVGLTSSSVGVTFATLFP